MCPFCLATLAFVAVGATSAGGLAALAVKHLPREAKPEQSSGTEMRGENQNVYQRDGKTESSIAG